MALKKTNKGKVHERANGLNEIGKGLMTLWKRDASSRTGVAVRSKELKEKPLKFLI